MQALTDPRLRRASALLVALAAYGTASANYYDQTYTHVDERTSWQTNLTQAFTKFNPLLGTLTSVDFYLGGTMVTQAQLNNKNVNMGQFVSNTTTGNYYILGTGMDSSSVYFQSSSTPYTVSESLAANNEGGSQAYNAPHGITEPAYNLAFTSTAASYTDPATLAKFTGPGSISLMFFASAGSNGNGGVNINVGNITTANGSGFVRYNYAPVPEPVSCAALAVGAVTLMRRRKGAKR